MAKREIRDYSIGSEIIRILLYVNFIIQKKKYKIHLN